MSMSVAAEAGVRKPHFKAEKNLHILTVLETLSFG